MTPDFPRPVDLSVVVGTAHPSDELDRLLATLLPQLAAVRGELVLADGSHGEIPTPEHPEVSVVHLRRPGADVFDLRAAGGAEASGWVVAFTEDHCTPVREDWCRQILRAHVRHGSTAAVAGSTSNGTARTLWHRANFLITFAPVLPPLPPSLGGRVPPPANISVKREVLETFDLTRGFLEFELMPHLMRTGNVALATEAEIAHYQGHSAANYLVQHFHNGRTTGGLLPRDAPPRVQLRRVLTALTVIPRHTWQTAREIWRRPAERTDGLPALPLVAVLLGCHVVGELAGMALGPGASPHELD